MTGELDITPLVAWINERHAIYMRKSYLESRRDDGEHFNPIMSDRMRLAWLEGSWRLDHLTDDPVLGTFRFCNVYRELDRVTVWIREHIREPYREHPHLWFMLAISRYINWPPALQELMDRGAWPDATGFRPNFMTEVLEQRRNRGDKVETGAYMIRAESDEKAPWYSWSKQRYVSEVVLGKLWESRLGWQTLIVHKQQKLHTIWSLLQDPMYTGWGPFMSYQLVVDLRHTRYLHDAPDINTWSALGPGSRRGLNRLHGRPVGAPLSQDQGLAEMLQVRQLLAREGVLAPWVDLPELSDVQNCLCETDKWLRASTGEGRPRSKYVPGRGS